ncbi:DUF2520 domain-containing protein [Wenzhouxiangella sp. XN79A]|uniref:Rossmann-like and DUF2520 domain-containing protein n=1 Tax=Wenzhouxiangella sp. XN79A TaxID=2724193 RepID=UPI00144ACBFD|nr:Rossmann-like and DUF2520 domain-containing protein [Wenzhouxiangella sp. XN79A]NKI34451.1 DUF2520 domain-containing protein [Wenzhouxiangella sp. XN79A]
MTPCLHILGAGRTARTLARLWHEAGVLTIGEVCNRSPASAAEAVDWIGQGRPVERFERIAPEDWLLIGVPDSAIAEVADAGLPFAALAFHLSGAEPASLLAGRAAAVAAVHPVCAFAEPDLARRQFPGRYAVGEGDAAALDRLLPAFEAIGARTLRFRPDDKRLYHAAMIAASNFLCTLDQLAEDLAVAGGLAAGDARRLIATLQAGALDTIAERGGAGALTGPIERGDAATCAAMMDRIRARAGDDEAFGRQVLPLLAVLAGSTVDLARRRHPDRAESLEALRALFEERAA